MKADDGTEERSAAVREAAAAMRAATGSPSWEELAEIALSAALSPRRRQQFAEENQYRLSLHPVEAFDSVRIFLLDT